MSLADLTEASVIRAVQEFDQLGTDGFLHKYGFRTAREYSLVVDGRRYPSKAIAGAAHSFARPEIGPLRSDAFSGGEATVKKVLERLGFRVERETKSRAINPALTVGATHSWAEVAREFEFKPELFQVAGGMLPRPAQDAILLITHPGGARSFDYEDRWDGDAMIYTGRGKTGDQRLEGANLDVAENRKQLFVFEAAGPKQLRYLGRATCSEHWTARSPDRNGQERLVFKFRLVFNQVPPQAVRETQRSKRQDPLRQPRPFQPGKPPSARTQTSTSGSTPEETAARQEKANQEHYRVLECLFRHLAEAGWVDLQEIPSGVDLWATSADSTVRVIFEVKTLGAGNEVSQCRAALSQLLEYRFFFGSDSDRLCLVVNGAISDRRRAFLEQHAIGVVSIDERGTVTPMGSLGRQLIYRGSISDT